MSFSFVALFAYLPPLVSKTPTGLILFFLQRRHRFTDFLGYSDGVKELQVKCAFERRVILILSSKSKNRDLNMRSS